MTSEVAGDRNDGYPLWETLSLCTDCARHETLKAFIQTHPSEHDRCGACLRTAPAALVCAVSDRQRLSYVLRALIRFYYDEDDYNEHLGGDSPQSLFESDNPILALDPTTIASEPEILDFLGDLAASLPTPSYDEGIWIFHQHDGWPAAAIARSESRDLREVRMRLDKENYFNLEPLVRTYLDRAGGRIDTTLPAGSRFYRARIGIADEILTGNPFDQKIYPRPHSGDALGAPPASKATAGRLNRAGVSFLYLASDLATAACEVRPHPTHQLSVGAYESLRNLRIANFTVAIDGFADNDTELDTFHFLHSTDRAMAMPVLPGDATRYMITQLIADVLRQLGYDGVRFASSVGAGDNFCLFNPDTFHLVAGSEQVHSVTRVDYALEVVESRLLAGENDRVRKV